ncbi:hypothetical protein U1Q18_017234 [Sarracenia purpurea var. burkii]
MGQVGKGWRQGRARSWKNVGATTVPATTEGLRDLRSDGELQNPSSSGDESAWHCGVVWSGGVVETVSVRYGGGRAQATVRKVC